MHSPRVLICRDLSGITLLNKGIFLPWLCDSLSKTKTNCFSSTQSVFLPYIGWVHERPNFQACTYTQYTICPPLSSTAFGVRKSYVSELYIPLCTIFYVLLSCFLGDLGPKRCKNVLMGLREGMVLILFWKATRHSRGLIATLVAAWSASQCGRYIAGRAKPTSWQIGLFHSKLANWATACYVLLQLCMI